ncbi:MAG: phage major tail tube protein [Betaproteobacteria bacterium]|nr:phage major tail tube protein [Betaproteobacteria bacterium]
MIPQVLTNMNLFIDGKGFAGDNVSLTLPKLKIKSEDHRAGGMDAPIKVDLGMEAMEASFALAGMSQDALKFFGLADQAAFSGAFRGAYKNTKGETVAAVATLRGQLQEVDHGDWKPGDKAETKMTAALEYYKLEISDKAIYEIDVPNMVRIIDGKDQLADVRKALGM